MNAKRTVLGLMLALGAAQSCSNDFDQFELSGAPAGSSSGGQLSLGGTTSKAGTGSARAGSGTSLAGTATATAGITGEGGVPVLGAAGTPEIAGAAGGGGVAGAAGAGTEPEPCGGPCALDHASAQCVNDACAIDECAPAFGDCNARAADGCEHALQADLENCGECARACDTANVAALECKSGACSSSCAPGFANCAQTESPDDGCETPVLTDAANCGGCDNACPSGFVCKAGRCACDFKNDCGNGNGVQCVSNVCECDSTACRPGERCRDAQGSKVCSCNGSTGAGCSANELCCAQGCADVLADAANCGACGHPCSAGFVCVSGACQCESAQDCGGVPELGEAGAANAGGAADGVGGAAPAPPVACVTGSCVCNGASCAPGQRCLPNGNCG